MNTYYLYYPDGITIDKTITKGFESQFVVTVKENGLNNALKELAELSARYGKKRHLEIHCHGLPGELLLGGAKAVTNRNVKMFGLELAKAITTGGLIELLACLVASQGGLEKVLTAPEAQIEGYREDYHGVLRLRRTRDYMSKELYPKTAIFKPLYNGEFTERKDAIKDTPNVFFMPKPEKDGLKFCLDLAATSQCTVRAAYTVQTEEGGDELFDSPIGNWENEVFDFQPNGAIKFLGTSPYRGLKMNSFDMDKFPPA